MPKCPKCENGFEVVDEDGMRFESPCYHCLQTGVISEEQEAADRLEKAAQHVGATMANEEQKGIDSVPDGDGYALCAAENGMSTWDYRTVQSWHFSDLAQAEMMKMDEHVRTTVVNLILAG